MIRNPDHVTLAVADPDAAIAFFGLLGFQVSHVARIDGGEPAHYMGMDSMQADHITLALDGSDPRFEIQLLHFDEPVPGTPDSEPTNHRVLGFNHLALRVDDLAATATHLEANGVTMLSDEMDYISRRLRFLRGPEGITIELVEWVDENPEPHQAAYGWPVTDGEDTMLEDIPALLPDLKALYEDLHANPELSFCEHRTAKLLAERLEVLGYDVTSEVGTTGVVAIMENGAGPFVLLRADIDALPVKEDTGLPYASTVTGVGVDGREHPVAHACGHDMHATWMVGVATLLATHRDEWQGKVMLLLQPAEELGAGASAMIDDGLYERFGTPDIGLGQHVAPAPAGWVLHRAGPVMSASDAVRVVMHGRGAHGSAPQQSVDPVVMAASTVMRLQTIVSREVAATETAVVTVGTLHAGTKENIISDHASMTLSIRTFDPKVRERVLDAVTRIVEGEAAAAGAPKPPEITSFGSFPMLSNDVEATERVSAAFTEALGSDRVIEGPLVPASEDFGIFGERGGFPSVFWFVGGADHETFFAAMAAGRMNEDIPSNHSPHYAPIQDPTITAGIEAMITAARCWLAPT